MDTCLITQKTSNQRSRNEWRIDINKQVTSPFTLHYEEGVPDSNPASYAGYGLPKLLFNPTFEDEKNQSVFHLSFFQRETGELWEFSRERELALGVNHKPPHNKKRKYCLLKLMGGM